MTQPNKKPRASVTMPICPHCQKAEGFRKTRGAYHKFDHDGQTIKLYYVRCKSCEGAYTLREVWPTGSPESELD